MSLPSTTQPYHPHTVSRTSPVLSVNGQTGNAAIKYLANVPSGDTAESDAWRLQATKGDIFSNTQISKIQQATTTGNGTLKCSVRNV